MLRITSIGLLLEYMEANRKILFKNGNVVIAYDADDMSMALTMRHLEDGTLYVEVE